MRIEINKPVCVCAACGHSHFATVVPGLGAPGLILSGWMLDADRNLAYHTAHDKQVQLTHQAMKVALLFASKPRSVLRRDDFKDAVGHYSHHRNVDVMVKRVRQALGFHPISGPIRTIRSVGYEYVP